MSLARNGWLDKTRNNTYKLTADGEQWAAQIVRLHRLWEVYLADYLGIGAERVHRNAEEMEHILTPELERELTNLLHLDPAIRDDKARQDLASLTAAYRMNYPQRDPHKQPITQNWRGEL